MKTRAKRTEVSAKAVSPRVGDRRRESGSTSGTPVRRRSKVQIGRILVPIDFSTTGLKALPHAVLLARQNEAEIILLHVVEPPFYPSEFGYLVPDDLKLAEKAKTRLEVLAARDVPAPLRAESAVRIGTPYQEIIEAARTSKADLIVLTTHGRTGISHAFLGSTAERVVRQAPCPVLTVRR